MTAFPGNYGTEGKLLLDYFMTLLHNVGESGNVGRIEGNELKTKEQVITILRELQGEYISGQDIANRIFVTRAAVWKAIKELQKEGHEIDAVTNKGYRLRYLPDDVEQILISEQLNREGIIMEVCHFHEVSSTNDVALERIKEQDTPVLVLADTQTKGRGRRGRTFYSPCYSGLYMSIAFRTNRSYDDFKHITAIAATATAQAIDTVAFDGRDTVKIKWVNDIYQEDRKIAGILTELYGALEDEYHYIVIGIGINVYMPRDGYPKEIKNLAGAIFQGRESREKEVKNRICVGIISRLMKYMQNKERLRDACLKTYREKSFLIGNYVKINSFCGEYRYAFVNGIGDDYELLVTYEDGSKGRLNSGEVSVVKY